MPPLEQLSSSTLADQAYAALRDAIIDGELPRGSKITERGLAGSLRISPTPVREALRRLEQDRLVERTGPRSLRVSEFDGADLTDVMAIEDTLRAVAARLAARNATEAQVAAMRRELDAAQAAMSKLTGERDLTDREMATTAETAFDHTRAFHHAVDEASNTPLVLHLLQMVEAFSTSQRRATLRRKLAAGDVAGMAMRFPDHRRIFDAISARDEDLAEQLMLKHCRERASCADG